MSRKENLILKNREKTSSVLKSLPLKVKHIEKASDLDRDMAILREEWLLSKERGLSLPEETALVLRKIETVLSETISLDEENSILFVKRMQEETTEKKEINIPGQNAVRAMKAYGKKGKL